MVGMRWCGKVEVMRGRRLSLREGSGRPQAEPGYNSSSLTPERVVKLLTRILFHTMISLTLFIERCRVGQLV